MDTIQLTNAKHWEPNSIVFVKEDYCAGDEAWAINQLLAIAPDSQQATGRHKDILIIKRLVQPGSQVTVRRSGGRVKTVQLPAQAEELLISDLNYIAAQIQKINEPMSEEEQAAFLASASAPSGANS